MQLAIYHSEYSGGNGGDYRRAIRESEKQPYVAIHMRLSNTYVRIGGDVFQEAVRTSIRLARSKSGRVLKRESIPGDGHSCGTKAGLIPENIALEIGDFFSFFWPDRVQPAHLSIRDLLSDRGQPSFEFFNALFFYYLVTRKASLLPNYFLVLFILRLLSI